MSQYIRKLEENLGFALFERRGAAVTLTDAGKEYVAFARETLQARDRFFLSMDDMSALRKGHLKIGVSFFRSMYFVPKLIPAFREKYPGIEVELYEQAAPALERAVAHGEIDIALSNVPVYVSGVAFEHLADERVLLAMPPGHPPCASLIQSPGGLYPSIGLRKAAGVPYIMMPSHYRLRIIANHICLDSGFVPSVILETSNFGTAQRLVSEGFGFTFTPETLIFGEYVQPGPVYATFFPKDYIWPIAALYSERHCPSDAARAFIAFSKAILGSAAGGSLGEFR